MSDDSLRIKANQSSTANNKPVKPDKEGTKSAEVKPTEIPVGQELAASSDTVSDIQLEQTRTQRTAQQQEEASNLADIEAMAELPEDAQDIAQDFEVKRTGAALQRATQDWFNRNGTLSYDFDYDLKPHQTGESTIQDYEYMENLKFFALMSKTLPPEEFKKFFSEIIMNSEEYLEFKREHPDWKFDLSESGITEDMETIANYFKQKNVYGDTTLETAANDVVSQKKADVKAIEIQFQKLLDNEGFVSYLVDSCIELFSPVGTSRADVNKTLKTENNNIEILRQTIDKKDMTAFFKTYKAITGVNFKIENFINLSNAENKYQMAEEAQRELEIANELEQNNKHNWNYNLSCAKYGISAPGTVTLPSPLEKALLKLTNNNYSQASEWIRTQTEKLGIENWPQKDKYNALVEQFINYSKTNAKIVLGDKSVDDLKKEYTTAIRNAYGNNLPEEKLKDYMETQATAKSWLQTGVMIGCGMFAGPGALAMIIGGVSLLEKSTDKNGLTATDIISTGGEVALTYAGFKIFGAVSNKTMSSLSGILRQHPAQAYQIAARLTSQALGGATAGMFSGSIGAIASGERDISEILLAGGESALSGAMFALAFGALTEVNEALKTRAKKFKVSYKHLLKVIKDEVPGGKEFLKNLNGQEYTEAGFKKVGEFLKNKIPNDIYFSGSDRVIKKLKPGMEFVDETGRLVSTRTEMTVTEEKAFEYYYPNRELTDGTKMTKGERELIRAMLNVAYTGKALMQDIKKMPDFIKIEQPSTTEVQQSKPELAGQKPLESQAKTPASEVAAVVQPTLKPQEVKPLSMDGVKRKQQPYTKADNTDEASNWRVAAFLPEDDVVVEYSEKPIETSTAMSGVKTSFSQIPKDLIPQIIKLDSPAVAEMTETEIEKILSQIPYSTTLNIPKEARAKIKVNGSIHQKSTTAIEKAVNKEDFISDIIHHLLISHQINFSKFIELQKGKIQLKNIFDANDNPMKMSDDEIADKILVAISKGFKISDIDSLRKNTKFIDALKRTPLFTGDYGKDTAYYSAKDNQIVINARTTGSIINSLFHERYHEHAMYMMKSLPKSEFLQTIKDTILRNATDISHHFEDEDILVMTLYRDGGSIDEQITMKAPYELPEGFTTWAKEHLFTDPKRHELLKKYVEHISYIEHQAGFDTILINDDIQGLKESLSEYGDLTAYIEELQTSMVKLTEHYGQITPEKVKTYKENVLQIADKISADTTIPDTNKKAVVSKLQETSARFLDHLNEEQRMTPQNIYAELNSELEHAGEPIKDFIDELKKIYENRKVSVRLSNLNTDNIKKDLSFFDFVKYVLSLENQYYTISDKYQNAHEMETGRPLTRAEHEKAVQFARNAVETLTANTTALGSSTYSMATEELYAGIEGNNAEIISLQAKLKSLSGNNVFDVALRQRITEKIEFLKASNSFKNSILKARMTDVNKLSEAEIKKLKDANIKAIEEYYKYAERYLSRVLGKNRIKTISDGAATHNISIDKINELLNKYLEILDDLDTAQKNDNYPNITDNIADNLVNFLQENGYDKGNLPRFLANSDKLLGLPRSNAKNDLFMPTLLSASMELAEKTKIYPDIENNFYSILSDLSANKKGNIDHSIIERALKMALALKTDTYKGMLNHTAPVVKNNGITFRGTIVDRSRICQSCMNEYKNQHINVPKPLPTKVIFKTTGFYSIGQGDEMKVERIPQNIINESLKYSTGYVQSLTADWGIKFTALDGPSVPQGVKGCTVEIKIPSSGARFLGWINPNNPDEIIIGFYAPFGYHKDNPNALDKSKHFKIYKLMQ